MIIRLGAMVVLRPLGMVVGAAVVGSRPARKEN